MSKAVEPADAEFDAWLAEGRELAGRHWRNLWDIGDWWARGEHAYGDRARLAVEAFTGAYSYGTLRNIGSVAKRIEPSRRRDNVAFSKHAEVASLAPDEQQAMLELAASERLSVRALRKAVAEIANPVTHTRLDHSPGQILDKQREKLNRSLVSLAGTASGVARILENDIAWEKVSKHGDPDVVADLIKELKTMRLAATRALGRLKPEDEVMHLLAEAAE